MKIVKVKEKNILLKMGLHRLDFFSNSPKNFIFHNTSNKTNLGGVLTLIYIILFIGIIVYYYIEYKLKEDYSVEYSYYEEVLDNEQISNRYNDEKYNEYLDFIFRPMRKGKKRSYLYQRIILINITTNQTIPVDNIIYARISDIKMYLAIDENYYDDDYFNKYDFYLETFYQGYVLDHQNESIPLHKINNKYIYNQILINPKNPILSTFNWKIIKYRPDKGFKNLWKKLKDGENEESLTINGVTQNSKDSIFLNNLISNDSEYIYPVNETNYRILGGIQYDIDVSSSDEYRRTKKDPFDSVSNACSLILALYNFFSFLFVSSYSNNFDNYKITEKILFNTKTIKFQNKSRSNSIELRQDYKKDDSLLPHNSEDNIMIINDEKTEKYEKENISQDNEEDYIQLPKLKFYEYIFNNVYSKCCKMNNQNIISKCNEIISKYYSIEHILYNQLKLENLFKDYRWNDPALNNYENNELIIDLKNLISFNEKT